MEIGTLVKGLFEEKNLPFVLAGVAIGVVGLLVVQGLSANVSYVGLIPDKTLAQW